MEFHEKYCSVADQLKPENKDKIPISNEAMAIGELLNKLAFRLGRLK